MIKYVVNNNGITNFPVRNIYYYINGMGWDHSSLLTPLLGFCEGSRGCEPTLEHLRLVLVIGSLPVLSKGASYVKARA